MFKRIILFIIVLIIGLYIFKLSFKTDDKYSDYHNSLTDSIEEVQRITLTKSPINQDIVGRVTIENVIDEVVVQGKDNIEYTRKNLNHEYDVYGTVFMDYRTNTDSKNKIIYGHSSKKEEVVFTRLMNYLDYEFLCKNPFIHFINEDDTLYKIISVYTININEYFNMEVLTPDFINNALFERAVKNIVADSIFDLDFDTVAIQELLTLVTCNTLNSNERLIVVAAKI